MCFRALFLGTHTRKKDNGNPTMNYFIFIYELNSNRKTCPTETEFGTCYPLAYLDQRQRWTPVERLIHSDRHEGPTPLHCQNPCCIFEAVDLLASLMVQPSSRGAPFLLGPQRQNVGLVPTVHHGRKDSPSREDSNTQTQTIRLI